MADTTSNTPRPSFFRRVWNFAKSGWGITLIVIILAVGAYFALHKTKSPYTFVPVTQGPITESVSVTGNTTPIQSVTLGFANSGTISAVYSDVGQHVTSGQVLAQLNVSDLNAQLAQAQANVDTQTANLENLKAGAQPADIASSQAALDKANQDLANMYSQISDIANDAFSKANDAVRTQTNGLFSNPENSSIQLMFNTNNSQAGTNARTERLALAGTLNIWQQELLGVDAQSSTTQLDSTLQDSLSYLSSVHTFLLDISSALNGATNVSTTALASDQMSVGTALSEVNTAVKNLNTIEQNISSQKLLVTQAQANLTLKKAGSTQQAIDAQQAQVEQAQASVASVEAKLANSKIVSPIDGVVTQFDAKVGQIASPGVTLVSVISGSQFEVDAEVPETDIGKVAVGNKVDMTFDAFPNDTFTGKVFYIDPAETIDQGVVDYKVKVSFDTPDARIKSGLTTNLTIETKTDQNALILPQYAIVQNNSGTFVEVLQGKTATDTPVTLGIQDLNGNVEILSGVTAGEQVINIGLKQ